MSAIGKSRHSEWMPLVAKPLDQTLPAKCRILPRYQEPENPALRRVFFAMTHFQTLYPLCWF